MIVAEAGVNHNGDIELAQKLVRAAKTCGADCIKFQTFKANRIVTQKAPKAEYQLHTTDPKESQLEMLKKLELTEENYVALKQLCRDENILFLSTPYNIEDVDFLYELGVPAFKVASGQTVEPHFLKHVAKTRKPIFLSTGMCTLAEVDEAVRVIRDAGNNDVVVFQCTTNYPSAIEDCNLRAMVTMGNAFDVLVGYSDHTQSLTSAIVAVSLGACVIERHFTLDKKLPGPDHASSSNPKEFRQLVKLVRETELCLGSSLKYPTEIEQKNAIGMRRSIVAKCFIPAGTIFSWNNLTFKRPAVGLLASYADLLLGEKASRDIAMDTIISLDMVE